MSLGGGENEIETIFGQKIATSEPMGSFVFMNEMRPVHRLTNKSSALGFVIEGAATALCGQHAGDGESRKRLG